MRLRESLVLYKPFNTLWIVHNAYPSMGCSAASQAIPAAAAAASKLQNVSFADTKRIQPTVITYQ
jgi:hypothetical protein